MFSNGQCSLKFRKRDKLWKNSTGTCTLSMHDKKNLEARSYSHWLFLTNMKGLVVFNNYGYSTSTNAHQSAVMSLLKGKVKIDLIVNQRQSLDYGIDLVQFYKELLLSQVRLSKKRLSKKSRQILEDNVKYNQSKIEKLVKTGLCKKLSKTKIQDLKTKIVANEESRLTANREKNRLSRQKRQEVVNQYKTQYESTQVIEV